MEIGLKKFEQLKASGELPSPKGVALSIVRLTQREDVSNSQLEQVIKSDPAFVGRLLKTANITARENGRPVASVPDAMNVLGIMVVRNLALGFSLVSGYRTGACPGFDYSRFWTDSLVSALALQAVARRAGVLNPEEAFCCGLLAGIGKLALATVHSQEYSRVLAQMRAQPTVSLEQEDAVLRTLENEAFALHHDDLTAAMLTDWGFPRVMVEPLYHRRGTEMAPFASGSRGEKLHHAARLADALAAVCLADEAQRAAPLGLLAGRAELFGMDPEVVANLVDGVVRDWRDWAGLLQLDAPPEKPSYANMAAPNDAPCAAPGEAAGVVADARPTLRVLLALPDAAERAALTALLLGLDYQVFEADTGQQALELALGVQPHILLLDWHLLSPDGLQLTRTLRATRLGRAVYILILAGSENEPRIVEAFEAGADDCLLRPLSDKVLLARLNAGARLAQLHEEVQRDHEDMAHIAAELAVSNRRLHEVSMTDPLTGFPNRRYAMERLEKEWIAGSRSGRPLSCMMIDLNDFKQVNDRFGHDVGDAVLVALARALKEALRAHDVICRVGGDEFLVISPDTADHAIRQCAVRLQAAVEAMLLQAPQGEPLRCSVSIGTATRDVRMQSMSMLIKAADEQMYLAKPGGRTAG